MTTARIDYLADMRACVEAINLNPPGYHLL
jgi:hypothetical protein